MCEGFVSQQPPNIVTPLAIIFFENSKNMLSVYSSLVPIDSTGFAPTSSPGAANL